MQNAKQILTPVQEFANSLELFHISENIGGVYGLLIDQIGELDSTIQDTLLETEKAADFTANISKRLGIDAKLAQKITNDVNTQVFKVLRTLIQDSTTKKASHADLEKAGNFTIERENAPLIQEKPVEQIIKSPSVDTPTPPVNSQQIDVPLPPPRPQIITAPEVPEPPQEQISSSFISNIDVPHPIKTGVNEFLGGMPTEQAQKDDTLEILTPSTDTKLQINRIYSVPENLPTEPVADIPNEPTPASVQVTKIPESAPIVATSPVIEPIKNVDAIEVPLPPPISTPTPTIQENIVQKTEPAPEIHKEPLVNQLLNVLNKSSQIPAKIQTKEGVTPKNQQVPIVPPIPTAIHNMPLNQTPNIPTSVAPTAPQKPRSPDVYREPV